MSGFNKRSRLSPSTGKSGNPPKEQPQPSSGASGQQKAPAKKLQWSMNDLLTKLDSGDANPANVQEAMAEARAGEANAQLQSPPTLPATHVKSAQSQNEPALAKPSTQPPPEPQAKQPIVTQPPAKEPIVTQPPAKEPIAFEPTAKESVVSELAKEPVVAEGGALEPTVHEPPTSEFGGNYDHSELVQDESFEKAWQSEVIEAAPTHADAATHDPYVATAKTQEGYAEAAPVYESNYSTPDNYGTFEHASQNEYSEYAAQNDYAEPVIQNECVENAVQNEYAETATQNEYAESPAQNEYAESAAPNEYTESPAQNEYAESAAPNEYTESPAQNEYAESPAQNEYAESAAPNEYTESPAQNEYAESPAQNEYAESPAPNEYTESPAQNEYAESAAPNEYTESPAQNEYAESPAPNEYTESPAQNEYAESPAPNEYAESPAQNEYAESPTPNEYAESPAPNEYAESPAQNEYAESAAPNEYAESAAPNEYAESPAQYEPVEPAAPNEYAESAAPNEYAESPAQYEPVEPAAPNEYAESPTQYESVESPAQNESVEPAALNESVELVSHNESPEVSGEAAETSMPDVSNEQSAELTQAPPMNLDDTGEIPRAAFAEYIVTMSAKAAQAEVGSETPDNAADTAGLKPEPPSAKPAFGAAAMLMKKAAEKKSAILRDTPQTPEPVKDDRDEPYSFTLPEFSAPEPVAAATEQATKDEPKSSSEPLQFDLENETGRIDAAQLKSLPPFGQFQSKKTAPAENEKADAKADADGANPEISTAASTSFASNKTAPPAGISASIDAAPFGRRDDETGRINMRELMEQMPPHMAAALDKSAKPFEPGEEPQMFSAPAISNPVSPPNQFNRAAILPNIKAEPAAAETAPKTDVPAAKSKKKKTKETKPSADPPQSQVVKNIQKMAPLSSMRAAEHHDLATQEAKAEHKELLNQTNQIKNKMLTVPDTVQESEFERVWKGYFASTMRFAGKYQRHLVAVAGVALLIMAYSVIGSALSQSDLLNKIANKWQHKQFDDATDLVDRGLAQFPNNANLHFYKARLLVKGAQENQALTELTTATNLDPNNLAMLEQRAKLYIEMHKYDEATGDYNRLLASPEYNTKAYMYANRATALMEKGRYDVAFSDADKAIKLEPNKPDYYATRAYVLAGQGNFSGAINDWSTVIAKDHNDANAYAERARAEFSNNQANKALADLAKSIAIKPTGTAFYYRGLMYRDQKKTQEAIQEFNQALKYDSTNPSYRDAVARLYANNGNFQQAMRNYDAVGALQRMSESPETLQNRVMAEMRASRIADAARDLERYLVMKPGELWALYCHAECCIATKEYVKAYDDFTQLIAKDPKNAMYYAGRGQVSSKEQHYDLAASDFEKAIALAPKKADLYTYRGASSASQGLYDQAQIDFKHALALQPDNALAKKLLHDVILEAKSKTRPLFDPSVTSSRVAKPHLTGDLVNDGYTLMSAGNLPDAIQLLSQAVTKNPNNATARRYLAYCLLDNGDERGSIAQFKALDMMGVLNSSDETKYIDALTKGNNFSAASVVVARKLAIHPDSIDTRVELANLYMQLSWKDKARQVVIEGLNHSTSATDSATLRSMLDSINQSSIGTPQNPSGLPPKKQPNIGG